MDYCIHDVRRNGRNAVEEYLVECPPSPDSDEAQCLSAMRDAKYALVVVLEVQSGVGCLVENLYTDKQHLLVDMGLSRTATPGLLLATRLLDFGKYHTTGGAAIPLGVLDEKRLNEWRKRLSASSIDDSGDHAALIRNALRRGASSHIRFASAEESLESEVETAIIPQGDPAARRRQLAKYVSARTAPNQRCRCGSGKMYKNCCMKHQP
jgi:hypothetical protein